MAKSSKRKKRKSKSRPSKAKPAASKKDAAEIEAEAKGDDASEDAEPKPRAPSEPAPRDGAPTKSRPWWIIAAILAVVGVVAYQQIDDGADTAEDLDEVGGDVVIEGPPPGPERLRVTVHERYPHDTEAFTQGLLWHDGYLYESTGLRGESSLRHVDLESGRVLQLRSNEDRLFAEGLARVGDELYQLTWQAGEAHVWTVNDFEHLRTLRYDGEGWGLCYDGEHLVMSDGSDRLAFRTPAGFEIDHVVRVRDEDGPVRHLNELECVDGAVWANVWQTDRIVRIDPVSGRVTATVDASGLLSQVERWEADVLNGIAWVPERERFLITGKHWPWMFEVEFVPIEDGDEG